MDITELILHDHHEQRRMFAFLEDVDRSDREALGAVWARLCVLLEVHAAGEEELFYPQLLKTGKGVGGQSPESEVRDVIKDHNEIRDAIRHASELPVGSDDWWKAVRDTNKANSDHMAEEERDDLADFRVHAPLQLRHDIAVAFARYEAERAGGISAVDRDPQKYLDEHMP